MMDFLPMVLKKGQQLGLDYVMLMKPRTILWISLQKH
jgi:hypothetical protein